MYKYWIVIDRQNFAESIVYSILPQVAYSARHWVMQCFNKPVQLFWRLVPSLWVVFIGIGISFPPPCVMKTMNKNPPHPACPFLCGQHSRWRIIATTLIINDAGKTDSWWNTKSHYCHCRLLSTLISSRFWLQKINGSGFSAGTHCVSFATTQETKLNDK